MRETLVDQTGILDAAAWDYYVSAVAGQVTYDDMSSHTIRGISLEEHLTLGLFEEYTEVLCDDGTHDEEIPGYRRFDALVKGRDYVNAHAGEAGQQVKFHANEFGDSLWFVTNYAALFDIHMGEVAHGYANAAELEFASVAALSSRETSSDAYPQELGWFRNSAQQLFEVVGTIFNRPESPYAAVDEHTKEMLKVAAGRYLAAMELLAESTFGLEIAEIMEMNIEKVNARIKRGTVIRGNGDSR